MDNVNRPLTHRQRQALETQRIIVEAARELFLDRGYAATTMDAIADRAGVAISTVYAIYKNKRGILRAMREDWHLQSGQREIYQRALEAPDPAQKLRLAAHATRRQWETSADLIAIYRGAATADPEAAAELDTALSGRRQGMTRFIHVALPALRPGLDPDRAAAIFLALTRAELYEELVNVAGWSADEYESWLTGCLRHQFTEP